MSSGTTGALTPDSGEQKDVLLHDINNKAILHHLCSSAGMDLHSFLCVYTQGTKKKITPISKYNYIVVCNSSSYSTLTLSPTICRLLRDGQPEGTVRVGCGVMSRFPKHDVSAQVRNLETLIRQTQRLSKQVKDRTDSSDAEGLYTIGSYCPRINKGSVTII